MPQTVSFMIKLQFKSWPPTTHGLSSLPGHFKGSPSDVTDAFVHDDAAARFILLIHML